MAKFSDEEVAKILQGRRVVSRVPFPGTEDNGVEVGIRSLTESEMDTARIEAHDYLRRQCERGRVDFLELHDATPDALDRERMRQILLIACVDPEDGNPFFVAAKQVRDLDNVTLARLYEAYENHLDAVNPRASLTDDQVRELADILKKEPSASAFLAGFERATLTSLIRTLGNQLKI